MAKKKDATSPAIEPDTVEMLANEVKKKKPRKFFMVYKGTQLKTLVVFKKGPFGPKVMAAKKSGHIGDICMGVVVGSGEKLSFLLPGNDAVAGKMKVDSCSTKQPIEDAKFKKFLKDNDLKYKPSFEVIVDPEDAPDPESDGAVSAAASTQSEGSGAETSAATSESAPATSDRAPEFARQQQALEERFLQAKRADPDKATKLGAVWDFAAEQAEGGNYDKARESLARLENAIDAILSAPAKTDAEKFGIEEGLVEATKEKLIAAFEKSKVVWERTRDSIQKELRKLEESILEISQGESDFDHIQQNSGNVYVALDELDDELIEVLEDAVNTNDEDQRLRLHAEAREIVQRYRDFLADDPFLSEVDQNPFTPVKVRATLDASLNGVDKALKLRLVTA